MWIGGALDAIIVHHRGIWSGHVVRNDLAIGDGLVVQAGELWLLPHQLSLISRFGFVEDIRLPRLPYVVPVLACHAK